MEIKVLAGEASCGSCTACCSVLGIRVHPGERKLSEQGDKAPGTKCQFCLNPGGCSLYGEEDRPEVCKKYECWWLASQKTTAPMVIDLRPDKCRAVIDTDLSKQAVCINVAKYDFGVWTTNKALKNLVKVFDKQNMPVYAICGTDRRALNSEAVRRINDMEFD